MNSFKQVLFIAIKNIGLLKHNKVFWISSESQPVLGTYLSLFTIIGRCLDHIWKVSRHGNDPGLNLLW